MGVLDLDHLCRRLSRHHRSYRAGNVCAHAVGTPGEKAAKGDWGRAVVRAT